MRNKCSEPVRNRRYIEKELGTVSPPIFLAQDAHNRLYKTHMGCSLQVEVTVTDIGSKAVDERLLVTWGPIKINHILYSDRISYFNEVGFASKDVHEGLKNWYKYENRKGASKEEEKNKWE